MVVRCPRVRALLRGRSWFNVRLLHLSFLQSTWIRELVASLEMNDEQRDWEKLLERLEDQGERMYGAMLFGGRERPKVVMDNQRQGAAQMYRENLEGCRDIWKASYRHMKELRAKGVV